MSAFRNRVLFLEAGLQILESYRDAGFKNLDYFHRSLSSCVFPLQSLQLHEHLADVLAGEELQEGGGRLLDAMFHRLPKGNFAPLDPLVHSLDERCAIAQVIRDKKPLKKQTHRLSIHSGRMNNQIDR